MDNLNQTPSPADFLTVTALHRATHAGMVPCSVESHYTAWLVTFDTGETLLLQSDYDQAAFAVHCGAIKAPEGWDGLPSKLGEDWLGFDSSTISHCPDDYLDVAEPGETP